MKRRKGLDGVGASDEIVLLGNWPPQGYRVIVSCVQLGSRVSLLKTHPVLRSQEVVAAVFMLGNFVVVFLTCICLICFMFSSSLDVMQRESPLPLQK